MAGTGTMRGMRPLPLAPAGSREVCYGVSISEDATGCGSVFVWGMAAWSWQADDEVARRLAAVQLVETNAASQRQVAGAFLVNENTVARWRSRYAVEGALGLVPERPGPKGPSKLTEAKTREIKSLRDEGLPVREIAVRVGVSFSSVSRVTKGDAEDASGSDAGSDKEESGALVPLAEPADRIAERVLARFGIIDEAPPVICEGASLPLGAALLILPALAATGLLKIASATYGIRRRAFYGLRSLVLSIVFSCLLGEPRAEGLVRTDPVDLGRLLGLDRAPEVRTLRRRTEELAKTGRTSMLIEALPSRSSAARRSRRASSSALSASRRRGFVTMRSRSSS